MNCATIPGVDKRVSRIVLGTMIVNTDRLDESFALLDAAAAHGITTIDTAYVYGGGKTELAIGKWFAARGNRDRICLLGKGAHPADGKSKVNPQGITADLTESLRRFETDHIDVYLLHRDDPSYPVGPIVETLNEHRAAGRIGAFGGSNWRHERIAEANEYAEAHGLVPFAASSPNYGLAEQVDDPWGPGCVSLSGPKEAAARAWYAATGMAIFAYSSIGRGFFSGRIGRDNYATAADGACRKAYCHEVNFRRLDRARELAAERGVGVAQIALAYVLNAPLNVFALVGAANESEIAANDETSRIVLSPDEMAWLNLERDSVAAE
jgi:aryl-alcohol dehydrogenase-like predicted oxidoreductase